MAESKTTAIVDVSLRIQIPSRWGDDCKLAQVRKQAREEASTILKRALTNYPIGLSAFQVTTIMDEETPDNG